MSGTEGAARSGRGSGRERMALSKPRLVTARELRREFRPMLRLAGPLVMAELGWMAMGIVDSIMAGRLGAAPLGAGSLGSMVFYPVVIAGTGLLLGMDTLAAQAFGAEDPAECRRALMQGLWLALALAGPLMAVILGLIPVLRASGTNPEVMRLLVPYLKALDGSIPFLLFYTAFRRYLQAVNVVQPVMFATVSANLINVLGNWVLMYGHWGVRPMGLEGSGWSTTLARIYMAGVLAAAIVRHERGHEDLLFRLRRRPQFDRIRRLVGLGLPAAGQILFEGAVFGIVTALAARLDEVSLAAHAIAVQTIATTYMVPLGISSAAAVRVGQAVGRGDRRGAASAGWTAQAMSALFMGTAGVAMALAPRSIVRIFIRDAAVVALGAVLLRMAALFQLFDGFQTVATGALRGLGDTRSPMLVHLAGYWAVGVPVVYVLCFPLGWGVRGIWAGLTAALILIGAGLLAVWHWRLRDATIEEP